MKGRRWVTGIGVGLAVFLVGGTFAPGEQWWGVALLVAAGMIAVGIARGI